MVRDVRIGQLDTAYKKSKLLGLGQSWLKWELQQHGVETVPPESADVVLASVQSQQAIGDLKRELKRNGVNPRRTQVVIGGPGAYAPAVFDGIAAAACVGEGRRFVATLVEDGLEAAKQLPNAWVPRETREVIPDADFPWDCPPIKYQDGTTRLWVSRGCKRKCLFCQTGWESTYRLTPDVDRVYTDANRLSAQGEHPFPASNDQTELDWSRLPPLQHVSATVVGLRKFLQQPCLRKVKSIRIGVEGVSERLRAALHKPIATSELAQTTQVALAAGRTLRWFLIAGLPGETDADWQELREIILWLKRNVTKGAVMMHFHAFIPHPAAPLSCLPMGDDYWPRFDEFRRWFFDGPGLTNRVQIMPCAKPPTRLKQAMESMSCLEADLRRGWLNCHSPNERVRYMGTHETRRHFARRYMSDLSAIAPTSEAV